MAGISSLVSAKCLTASAGWLIVCLRLCWSPHPTWK